MKNYLEEITDHQSSVSTLMEKLIYELKKRSENHDNSKFSKEEFSTYNKIVPELKKVKFGSNEYKELVKKLGPALEHHYENNHHHPEHFKDGINEMTLLDLSEMLCDWVAVAQSKGNLPTEGMIDYLFPKYGLNKENGIGRILINTYEKHI